MKLKLSEVASIAEIIASIGVIATLVFVGVELSEGNRDTRAATNELIIKTEMDMVAVLVENAGTWQKVVTGAPIAETLGRLAPSRGGTGDGAAGHEQASPRELIEILSAREKGTAHGESAGEAQREATTVVEWRYLANGHRGRTLRLSVVRAAPPYELHLAGLIMVEDVTELRRLEHQTMVRSRLSGIGEMALSLAHEIRNPLGSISLFATSLAHELEADSSLGRLAGHLVSGVRALEHVVSNVLDFARPRRFSMTQVDLAEVISETLIFIEHPRAQKSVRLSVDIEPWKEDTGEAGRAKNGAARRALIAGDAERLRQVFLNIALNALQAVDEGGSLSVALRRGGPRDSWEVEFSDDGVGIAPQDLERVFDPLFTTKENGSGLGLAIAHRILTAHGAQIEVESRPGEGATFRILFFSNFSPMEARNT